MRFYASVRILCCGNVHIFVLNTIRLYILLHVVTAKYVAYAEDGQKCLLNGDIAINFLAFLLQLKNY